MRTLGALFGLSCLFVSHAALASFTVYDDALSSSFSDKSVSVTPNYASTSSPYAGSDCISVILNSSGTMIIQSGGTPDISNYGGVDFYHRTNGGSITMIVQLRDSSKTIGSAVKVAVTTTWTNAHFTLSDFGLSTTTGIVGIQFTTSAVNVPGMALDEITLFDAPVVDAGLDATVLDGGPTIDAGPIDSGPSEGGATDASIPPDASEDAAPADASPKPDASSKDATPPNDDAGGEPAETTSGCSCDLAAPSGYTSAIPLALVGLALIARRRRS
jgi:MYXO-CTERM domain-containing protein